jgi:uncharacterized protein (TIGR02284 family)
MEEEAMSLREGFAGLREACVNCETLIEAAADVVEDAKFRRRLDERRGAWAAMSEKCAALLQESGGTTAGDPPISPTLHRAWVKIKAAINDEKGIVKECLRREGMVRDKLESMLRCDLPPETRLKLRSVLDRVVSLDVPP